MNMSNKLLIIGVLVIVVGLFAFSRINNNQEPSFGSDRTIHGKANISDPVSDQRNLAPDFTLESLGGGTITLSEYRGEKPVILDFFATWCPNCQRDMPKLNRWYEVEARSRMEPSIGPTHGVHPNAKEDPSAIELSGLPL